MRKNLLWVIGVAALGLPLAACNEPSNPAAAEQTFGSSPTLPAPERSWIPTVGIATATGWPAGGKPTAANGMAVNALATGLDHPRWLLALPLGSGASAGQVGQRASVPKRKQRSNPSDWACMISHWPSSSISTN